MKREVGFYWVCGLSTDDEIMGEPTVKRWGGGADEDDDAEREEDDYRWFGATDEIGRRDDCIRVMSERLIPPSCELGPPKRRIRKVGG